MQQDRGIARDGHGLLRATEAHELRLAETTQTRLAREAPSSKTPIQSHVGISSSGYWGLPLPVLPPNLEKRENRQLEDEGFRSALAMGTVTGEGRLVERPGGA